MEKEFIPYKLALRMSQLGYDGEVEFFKDSSEEMFDMRTPNDAPCILWQRAFRWFREKHNLKSCIMFRTSMEDNKEYYDWLIKEQEVVYRHFNTYEEAELACLKKLIEIVKNKDNE